MFAADSSARRQGRHDLGRPAGDDVPLPRSRTGAGTRRRRRARSRARVAVDRARASPAPPERTWATASASRPLRVRSQFRVVGIASNQQENGTALFVPLTTMRAILGASPAATSDYWVRTTSHDHALIDRTTTRLEDTLTAHGYDVGTEVEYVREADEVATFRTFTTAIAVLGFLIVAISMAGLANAITMSVIERTREVGILRMHRRARPRRPPDLRDRGPGDRSRRLGARDPARLPTGPLPRLAREGSRQRRRPRRLPARQPRSSPSLAQSCSRS